MTRGPTDFLYPPCTLRLAYSHDVSRRVAIVPLPLTPRNPPRREFVTVAQLDLRRGSYPMPARQPRRRVRPPGDLVPTVRRCPIPGSSAARTAIGLLQPHHIAGGTQPDLRNDAVPPWRAVEMATNTAVLISPFTRPSGSRGSSQRPAGPTWRASASRSRG